MIYYFLNTKQSVFGYNITTFKCLENQLNYFNIFFYASTSYRYFVCLNSLIFILKINKKFKLIFFKINLNNIDCKLLINRY